MTKQHSTALADWIREHNTEEWRPSERFTDEQIGSIARFCESQNPRFNRQHWLDYVAGTHGPNGAKFK